MNKLKQILDAMRLHTAETHPLVETERAIELIEAELAQPEQEPVGEVLDERGEVDWISFVPPAGTLLYTVPAQRQRLTEMQRIEVLYNAESRFKKSNIPMGWASAIIDAVEAAHDIKEQP